MVASSASTPGFSPEGRPHVVAAADGTVAVICEPARIVFVEVPSCSPFAELGLAPDATTTEVAWVGTPPRMLVLSRFQAHATVHLVDPFGPRAIAELRLEQPMRLVASVGVHALALGATGATVLHAGDRVLTPHPFPARSVPIAAGAAGSQFVVGLPGTLEEWDPQTRMPKRRLKLAKPVHVTAVGGSDRVVWFTTREEPRRIDVIPLVNRGQPKVHELPEPIAHVSSHPRSDLLVCVGATTGRVWVVDLDGRAGLRLVGPEGIDRVESAALVLGRVAGVLAAQTAHPLALVELAPREAPREAARERVDDIGEVPTEVSSLVDEPSRPNISYTSPLAAMPPRAEPPPAAATPVEASPPRAEASPAIAKARSVASPPPAAPIAPAWKPAIPPPEVSRRDAKPEGEDAELAAWRERIAKPRARTAEPIATGWDEIEATWREDLLGWARGVLAGDPPGDTALAEPFSVLAMRLDLPASLEPVLALAYGAHLLGQDGLAPADVARVVGAWDEALGRGELARRQLARYQDSRVHLARALVRVLDELPPETGALVGAPGMVSLLGPCVVVATGPLAIIAEACLSSIGGAIFAANEDAAPREVVVEARAYGAAPMMRVNAAVLAEAPTDEPLILVVDSDALAEQLAIPRLT